METQTRFTAKQAVSTQETRVESCAGSHPTLLTRSEQNFLVGYANIYPLHSGSHNWDSPWPATPGLKAPASLPTGVNCIPFRKNFWSPQPKVPAAISVENRWLPRAHRELVFSSRGRRHEARPVSNFSSVRGRLRTVSTPSCHRRANQRGQPHSQPGS